ncbi:DUF1398 family protein [Fluviicola taffensis]|uniref:DUF1398 domain-containing protein n=1 Tax=Fluviicola taffensis TaxID=191579 RepID=UPI003138279D
MFTIDQIRNAHSKVKSGADFPGYIQKIKALGVSSYETYVEDGDTDYHGVNGFAISSGSKYAKLNISDKSNAEQFKQDLKAHQRGETDYPTFCSDCAKSGVEKWVVEMERMTCAYYDKEGKELLVENIPQLFAF